MKVFLWNRSGLDIWQSVDRHAFSADMTPLSLARLPPPTPYIWLCRETRRSTPRSFSQLTQLARLSLLLHQPQPFPSVLDISSKVVRCTSIILFVLWDGGRHVIEYDVAAPPWWWHENRDIIGVWLQTKNWKKVRPWNCHLVVGCSKGRWLCLNYRGATPIWIFC